MRGILIGFVLCFVFLSVSAHAATYYVDATNGNDAWSGNYPTPQGSPPTDGPWKTISKVNSWDFDPGDSILFKRGEVWYEQLNIIWSGTSGHPITFKDYGSGALPIISGASAGSPTTPVRNRCIRAYSQSYFNLENLMTQYAVEDGVRTNGDGTGGPELHLHHVNITGCISHHNGKHGFKASIDSGGNDVYAYLITYTNCEAYNNEGGTSCGFQASDGSGQITHINSTSHDNTYGIRLGETQEALLQNCEVYNNKYGVRIAAWDVEAAAPVDITIEYCNIYNNGGSGDYAGIWIGTNDDWAVDGLIFRYNRIYNNIGEGIACYQPSNNSQVYYNLIWNNSEGGIIWQHYKSGSSSSEIYNNVVAYNAEDAGAGIVTGSSATVAIKNNIFYQNIIQQSLDGGTYDYNCWYPDWAGKGSNSISADPKFVDESIDDFHLQASSPGIDNGTDVGLTLDFEGNPVPQGSAPEIGAYEYAGAVCEPDTYYVDATGGNDNNDGRCTDTAWKTITKVNSGNFQPGDSILFKRGEEWREELIIDWSGSPGNPITFGSYGSGALPIINGALLVTGWTEESSNIWYASLSNEPRQAFFDRARGTKETAKGNLDAANEWYWESNTLYVYSTSDPDTAYTNPGVEADDSSRANDCCIYSYNDDYIDVKELDLRNTYHSNIGAYYCEHWNVYDCEFRYSAKRGIHARYGDYWNFYNNIMFYCGTEMATREHAVYFDGTDNAEIYSNNISYSWNDAIRIDGGDSIKVYKNFLHDNGQESGDYAGAIDLSVFTTSLSNVDIYYNLISRGSGDGYTIRTDDSGAYAMSNFDVYNNVFYDEGGGVGHAVRFDGISGFNFKNNIVYTAENYALRMNGCSGLLRDYNSYYGWTHGTYIGNIDGSWVTWSDVSSVETNSINSDPLFENPSNHNYHLQLNSPCIDNGTDVGLTIDFEGNSVPQGSAPEIGSYEYAGGGPPPQTCSDGTPYGACSSSQPQYCDNGNLVDDCNTCFCPGGYDCQPNGSCQFSGYSGPVALYHFDEGSGMNAVDSSGNGNDGTVYGATYISESMAGPYALSFDGSGDYVYISDSALSTNFPCKSGTGNCNISILFWIKLNAYQNDFICKLPGSWCVWNPGSGELLEQVSGVQSPGNMPIGEWVHVAVTHDGTYVTLYMNGSVIDGAPETNGFSESATELTIGYAGDYLNGIMDEVRIYNRALTSEEILNLYNNPGGEQIPGDLNNDGHVDVFDLGIIAANFGKTSGYDPEADVVENGEIDVFDLVFVASRFT